MPAAIGVAILGEVGLEAIIGTTIAGVAAETLVGYAALTVGTIGLQYGAQALQGGEKRADHQITVRRAVAPRRRVLGQAKLGGVIFALDTVKYTETNRILYRGAVHCVGPVRVLQYWLGDVKTGLAAGPGGTVPDSVYQGKVVIEGHAGTDDQPASAALLKLPYWTETMRLAGLCYSVVVAMPLKKGSQIFPEGAPDVRLLVAGAPSYDPRTGRTVYTDNAALVLLDYLMHASGYDLALDEIDVASFAALADICNEPVALIVPDPNGATAEMRYRSWGAYDYAEPRAEGQTFAGNEQVVASPTARWTAKLTIPCLGGDQVLAMRRVIALGRAATWWVGPYERPRAPWIQAPVLGGRVDDTTADVLQPALAFVLAEAGPTNATTLRLRRVRGGTVRPGMILSIAGRLHVVTALGADTSPDPATGLPGIGELTIAIRLWLRADHPVGTHVTFARPLGTMRLAGDETGAMNLDLARHGTVALDLVEAF